MNEDVTAVAACLMSQFAERTGLSPPAQRQQRYLWTDAFAVCNFLELFTRTGDQEYRRCATQLIEQVHLVLGRFRRDDARSGWISGLDDGAGRRHPTAGGLRIGKPLQERDAHEPMDERLEWDRDGQYFHYLTKWMHALSQASFVLGEPDYARWAGELATAAFKGFVRKSPSGEVLGVYWKMSTDMSRLLVAATGLHDALDGVITFRQTQHAVANISAVATDLDPAIAALSALCGERDWTTDDPLGLGGLLFDACRLCQLMTDGREDIRLLQSILESCRSGLLALLAQRQLQRPPSHRLAFRELGLAIGLSAAPMITRHARSFQATTAVRASIDGIAEHAPLGDEIVAFWLAQAQRLQKNWRDHQDINDVMLATALAPDTFLRVGVDRL